MLERDDYSKKSHPVLGSQAKGSSLCDAAGRIVRSQRESPAASLLRLLQAAVVDKVRPLLDVAAEEFLERRRVFADRLEPDLAQLGLGVRVPRDVHQSRAELFTDGWGYAGGPHDAHPSRGVEAGYTALLDRRHVRQCLQAITAGHRQHFQILVVGLPDRDRRTDEKRIDRAAE